MQPARIAELLEPFLGPEGLRPDTPGLLQDISIYIDILLRWNARISLTAIREEEKIVTRHFGESLFAARTLFPEQAKESGGTTLADIGSGAGFPGIPIKLWAPHVHVTLIESNQRKATFLREVVRALRLTDIDVRPTRAESSSLTFDTVTLRAVERFESILPIAARLVSPGGRLALLVGGEQLSVAQQRLPQMSWAEPQLTPFSRSRILAVAQERYT